MPPETVAADTVLGEVAVLVLLLLPAADRVQVVLVLVLADNVYASPAAVAGSKLVAAVVEVAAVVVEDEEETGEATDGEDEDEDDEGLAKEDIMMVETPLTSPSSLPGVSDAPLLLI